MTHDYKAEGIMVGVFALCLAAVVYGNHTHNNNLTLWAMGLAGQAFASITTLIVKGLKNGQ